MRLTIFEFKKIWKNRLLLPIVILLTGVSFLLFYEGPGITGAAQRRSTISYLKKDYSFWNSLSKQEQSDFRNAMISKYSHDVFSIGFFNESAYSLPGYFGDRISDVQIIYVVQTLDSSNHEIREVMDNVTEAAKFLGRQAVRSGDDYEIRRNLRIIPLYQERKELTREIRNWDRFLFKPYPMFIILLLVLFAVSGVFSGEKDRRMDILLLTSSEGRTKTAVSKYTAGMLSSAVIYILIRGVVLLSVHLNYGLMGSEQPVWGIQELINCPYGFTVWQYMLVSCGCELMTVLVMSVVFSGVSALSKNSIISYLVNVLLLGGCMSLFYVSLPSELQKGPLALMTPLRYFETYYTADILNHPIPWLIVHVFVWGSISVIFAVLSGCRYNQIRSRL